MRLTMTMSFCTMATACSTPNPSYCPGANPKNDNCLEADAGPVRCTRHARDLDASVFWVVVVRWSWSGDRTWIDWLLDDWCGLDDERGGDLVN
jgi:hypothetical protein